MRQIAPSRRLNSTLLFLVAACSSKGTENTQPESTTLTLLPTTGQVVQGQSTTVLATVTRVTGSVNLTVSGGSTDLTADVSDVQTTGNRTTAFITIHATIETGIGPYAFTVHGIGSGVAEVTADYTLTVTPAPASYTMTLAPATLSSAQGATAITTITLARINFAGPVTLSVDHLPTGVTASFAPPSPIGGNTSALTLTVAGDAPIGTFANLTAHGATQPLFGLPDVTVPLSLTITPAANPSLTTRSGASATVNRAMSEKGITTASPLVGGDLMMTGARKGPNRSRHRVPDAAA